MRAEPLRNADAIVVLGNRPPVDDTGAIRPELRRRIETGVALFQAGRAPILVVTGGVAPSGHVEAEVMRDHAVSQGVPQGRIRMEPNARDTIENAGFTLRMLCGDDPHCAPSIIVVSTPFHLPRARRLFECAGARVQLAPTPIPEDPAYGRRLRFSERLVEVYYGFIDECRRVQAARNRGPTR
ncbi:MAG: YdcF family protein [Myxococcota bacterium]